MQSREKQHHEERRMNITQIKSMSFFKPTLHYPLDSLSWHASSSLFKDYMHMTVLLRTIKGLSWGCGLEKLKISV